MAYALKQAAEAEPTPLRNAPFLGASLHQANQDYMAAFAKKLGPEITPTQLQVMWAVSDLDSPSQTDLVDFTGIDRSTLADVVRRLVKNGRLTRKRNKDDTRAYIVKLTSQGSSDLRQARQKVTALDAEIGAAIVKPLRR
jgi:DNA-binding MarR family transcriptional regulator